LDQQLVLCALLTRILIGLRFKWVFARKTEKNKRIRKEESTQQILVVVLGPTTKNFRGSSGVLNIAGCSLAVHARTKCRLRTATTRGQTGGEENNNIGPNSYDEVVLAPPPRRTHLLIVKNDETTHGIAMKKSSCSFTSDQHSCT
jgi:hypothetical protein